jgi:hypothetical protein
MAALPRSGDAGLDVSLVTSVETDDCGVLPVRWVPLSPLSLSLSHTHGWATLTVFRLLRGMAGSSQLPSTPRWRAPHRRISHRTSHSWVQIAPALRLTTRPTSDHCSHNLFDMMYIPCRSHHHHHHHHPRTHASRATPSLALLRPYAAVIDTRGNVRLHGVNGDHPLHGAVFPAVSR